MRANRIDPDSIDLDYLKQEFNRFRSEFAGVKEKLSGNATEALDQMNAYLNGGNLTSRIASLEGELEHLTGRLKGTGREAVISLEKQVGARPIVSIAVAFGAGLLAAQLLRRRS
ncbi:MAG: hypothetical protein B7Z80_15615 [Rhodospirillales bacterium 20-64-7]|nr:MAG: hypothetical protein B7Z80_15615 [Rhodospirillales bacterium 20-64-7]